ncbi:transaldolase family protein [Nanoarchaeota archaeon]
MKIFADTADKEEIVAAIASGIVDGVTTNPSLIKKAQEKYGVKDIKAYIEEILQVAGDKPVSLEVTETTYEAMKSEALRLWSLFKKYKNVNIKIPVNPSSDHEHSDNYDGIKLTKELAEKGIPVNSTLIMTPEQAVLAAKAGAAYVSPFAGRIDDYLRANKMGLQKGKGFDKTDYYPAEGNEDSDSNEEVHDNGIVSGVDLVYNIVQIFKNYGFKTEVLAASLRNARQVRECMLAGAHIATLPFNVLNDLTAHYLSVEGIIGFAKDTVPEYRELLKDKRKFAINVSKE